MTGGLTQFQPHVELLRFFLSRRTDIVDRIQGMLNAQRRPVSYLQDGAQLAGDFEDCLFSHGDLASSQRRLRGQLEAAHWANGFRPKPLPGLHNGLVDPGEMIVRAFHLWQLTRWPGRSGRVRYANTLFNLYVIRELELLTMRLWDAGTDGAGDRLAEVQGVLDQVWSTSPADQPVFVRDARWLIPMAQSPATDELAPYFDVAGRIAGSFAAQDRIQIHTANVRLAAGHLRSQIRYYATKNGVALDEHGLILNTRSSNALDFALLIQDLVPLLEAYEHAWQSGDSASRLQLADTICQGISPDPELFLHRVELLGAYSMIEHLFVTTDVDGHAAYTPMGHRHVGLFHEYGERIARLATPLAEDCVRFRPETGAYSPYGVLYGFSSDLIEHMALKATQSDAITRYGLEDVFTAGDERTGKLAWVNGWRKLPHLPAEVTRLFDYPQQFAADIFGRLEQALRRASSDGDAVPTGRLCLVPDNEDGGADAIRPAGYDQALLLNNRREGKCLVSYETPGGWVAVSKTILTELLAKGRDATIAGLPSTAVETLTLTCPGLIAAKG